MWKQVDDVLAPPTASNDVLGWYVCEGTDFEDIRARFKAVRDAFRVETEPGEGTGAMAGSVAATAGGQAQR